MLHILAAVSLFSEWFHLLYSCNDFLISGMWLTVEAFWMLALFAAPLQPKQAFWIGPLKTAFTDLRMEPVQ